jgi:hypothetical protein
MESISARAERAGAFASPQPPSDVPGANASIPRIARLMALAIRFDALLRENKIQDYAELARLGRVTRAYDPNHEAAPSRSRHSGTDPFSAER